MPLLTILIVIITERFKPGWTRYRTFIWFDRYVKWAQSLLGDLKFWDGPMGVLLILAPPLLLVMMLQYELSHAWTWLALPFATVVLFFSMGPEDLNSDVKNFLAAYYVGDDRQMHEIARSILKNNEAISREDLMRSLVVAILLEASDRMINVMFWFIVLGPMGAAFYRLSYALKDWCARSLSPGNFGGAAQILHGVLAWVPIRLNIFAYALAGNFSDAMKGWSQASLFSTRDWIANSRRCLVAAGLGALQLDNQVHGETRTAFEVNHVRAANALIWRVVILVMIMIALITIAGWIS